MFSNFIKYDDILKNENIIDNKDNIYSKKKNFFCRYDKRTKKKKNNNKK